MLKQNCMMCQRSADLTFHHLIPKTCHSNKWFKKNYSKHDMRTSGINICRNCHGFIHRHFSEKQLGREYYTLDLLLADSNIQNFIIWVKKQKTKQPTTSPNHKVNELITKKVQCPYCWETIDILIDGSIAHQNYIEDCQVCCKPITFDVTMSIDKFDDLTVIVMSEEN